MLLADLHGPFTLLPMADFNALQSNPNAREPGLFIWTFEHNKAHRIHYVGYAEDSIAQQNMRLVTELLLAERTIYDPTKIDEGELEILTESDSSLAQRCAAAGAAFEQIRRLRAFFAPSLGGIEIDKLVCQGIIRKLLKFGETPTAWLDHSLRQMPAETTPRDLAVRFQRPAFIASLPDEMYL